MFSGSKRLVGALVTVVAGLALLAPAASFAQGGPPPGRGGGGGGGGGGETTVANNLSVPTIMVGGGFTGVTCPLDTPSALVTPTGTPQSGYPINPAAFYYVQGVNTWQAQCYTAATASVTGAWGDNLTGDAKLSVGAPIRVELGLTNSSTATEPLLNGYSVVKLDPNALDRESAYGTLATPNGSGGFTATPTSFTPGQWRVFAAAATFSIQNVGTGAYVVQPGTPATAEINATGNVVYGYNLRVSTAGTYRITFTMPAAVSFTGADAGTASGNTASLNITVTSGRGGGAGGGRGSGGGGGGH